MEFPETAKTLKAALAKHLGVPTLPAAGWAYICEKEFVADYFLLPGPNTFATLVRHLRPFLQTPARDKPSTLLRATVPAADLRRAATYSRHIARLAAQRHNVQALRHQLFAGRVLSVAEAEHLLRQVGPRYFPSNWFAANGIPLLTHTSHFIDPHQPKCVDWTLDTVVRFTWDEGTLDIPNASRIDSQATQSGCVLRLPRGEIRIGDASVFSTIRNVAFDLSRRYDWDEAASTVFLLTGRPPYTPPVAIASPVAFRDDHAHFAIELRIEPWVSVKTVAKVYLRAQRIMVRKHAYPRGDRALVLFDFIEDYREKVFGRTWQELYENNVAFPWKDAAAEWNKTHGKKDKWAYRTKRMSVDFWRTWWTIVHPSGPLIEPSQPEDEQKRRTDPNKSVDPTPESR